VKLKLVLFLMDNLFLLCVGVLVLVGAIASRTSIPLAVVLVIACSAAMQAFLHNSNPVTPWLREQDDQVIFLACSGKELSPLRRVHRWLPSDPRCRLCLVPFGGVGKLLRITPSRKNPEFCTDCLEAAPVGAHDREVGILFADIRGFTAWSESRSPAEANEALTQFYALASRVLTYDDALVEYVGDQVMALYLPEFRSLGQRTAEVMVSAAKRLLLEIDREQAKDALRVGVGIHIGVASVGNVGKGETKDFTAVGDVVNTAARLQGSALAGQIVVSDEIYARATGHCSLAEPVSLSLKGKSEVIRAHVIHVHQGAA
jgi:adenylate cyclase